MSKLQAETKFNGLGSQIIEIYNIHFSMYIPIIKTQKMNVL